MFLGILSAGTAFTLWGIFPLYLRNTTCEKYGLKTGEGISDLVDYKLLKKEEVMKFGW
jgi:hypothetical protein